MRAPSRRRSVRLPHQVTDEPDQGLAPAPAGTPAPQWRARPYRQSRALLDGLLQRRAGRKLRYARRRDVDPLAGSRVASLTRAAVGNAELPETGEAHLAAAAQCTLDRLQESVDSARSVPLAEARAVCH